MECWVQEVYVIFPSLLFSRVKITFYCPNWYDKHSTNMSDISKTQNISPFLEWIFSTAVLTFGKISLCQWVFLKLINKSGSHLSKKSRHNKIAYDAEMISHFIPCLSCLCRLSGESVCFVGEQPKGGSISLKIISTYFTAIFLPKRLLPQSWAML